LAKEEGKSITRERFQATFGRQSKDVIPALLGEMSPQRVKKLDERKEALYRQIVGAKPPIMPGAAALVRELSGAGAKLAVGSSGPMENIELALNAMGMRELFSVIVSGKDVSRGKPDPQVFAMACERLGLQPERCVVIEDAPVGVDAAKAAGAKAVALLAHHPRESFMQADLIVEALTDLRVQQLQELIGAK
jgi:HAD superfamily hydrolase (TIGR01509 family)